jgi:MtN3 and saliva related transmembrane protein
VGGAESLAIRGIEREKTMSMTEIIGLIAAFAALPDVIGMLKRRSSVGMNPTMAGIMGTFQIVWVNYGYLINSRPVVVWNIIAVGINA